jgi:hypothetical protein
VLVYCPLCGAVQLEQVTSTVVLPSAETNWPATHGVFEVQTVAGSESWSQVPGAQLTGGSVSPAQYEPGLQTAQAGGLVGVAGAVSTLPAGHAPAGRHDDWLEPEVKVPAGHWAQVRSSVSEGVLATWLPGAQLAHRLHAAELGLVLKLPGAQLTQLRSLLAVPAFVTRVPAAHVVQAVQLVWFAVLEKVLAAHAAHP